MSDGSHLSLSPCMPRSEDPSPTWSESSSPPIELAEGRAWSADQHGNPSPLQDSEDNTSVSMNQHFNGTCKVVEPAQIGGQGSSTNASPTTGHVQSAAGDDIAYAAGLRNSAENAPLLATPHQPSQTSAESVQDQAGSS